MRRVLGLAVLLVCASALHGGRAAAQCGASCQTMRDLETGKVVGYACVEAPDSGTTCSATTRGCTIRTCEGFSMLLDTKGAVLASAQLCGGRVRGIRSVAVVPADPTAAVRVASTSGTADSPHDSKLVLAGRNEPAAIQ